MNGRKLLSILLASTLLGIGINTNVSFAGSNPAIHENLSVCDFSEIKDYEGYETLDILGSEYDLSSMDSGFLLVVIRNFDLINSGNLNDDEILEGKKYIKSLLDKYIENPEFASNLAITLEFGPSNMLLSEISLIQDKINELKLKQESIKNTKMAQQEIEAQVNEIQNEIDKLRRWINYSIFHFNSGEYKQTICNSDVEESKQVLMNYIYVNEDLSLIDVDVNTDGSFDIKNSSITNYDLSKFVKNALEYENIKLRNLYNEVDMIKKSKIVDGDQKLRVEELNKEIERVKAYALGQEIILLNLDREAVKLSRLSPEAIEQRVSELTEKINSRVSSIQKHKSDESYVISGFDFGDLLSYSGYVLSDESGFGIKLNLDSKNNIIYENIIGDDPKLSDSEKSTLKRILNKEIKTREEEKKALELKKLEIENSNNENKYYVSDYIDKNIVIKSNDITNLNTILSQL